VSVGACITRGYDRNILLLIKGRVVDKDNRDIFAAYVPSFPNVVAAYQPRKRHIN
jgi:hypothetical protein